MKRVLVCDDDPHLLDVLVYALRREGLEVVTVADGKAALEALSGGPFDLVLLDVLMPEMDGLEVCRRIRQGDRQDGRTPVVFLSSRDEEIDKVLGLELGGDDYVTKPFSPRELIARVKAVLRRAEMMHPDHKDPGKPAPATAEPDLCAGPLRLSPARHEATCEGRPVHLTVTEFGVLAALMERPGHVLSRGQLMERAYRYDNFITERTIDTHVKRIRKKFRDAGLGTDQIETIYGLGYKLRT